MAGLNNGMPSIPLAIVAAAVPNQWWQGQGQPALPGFHNNPAMGFVPPAPAAVPNVQLPIAPGILTSDVQAVAGTRCVYCNLPERVGHPLAGANPDPLIFRAPELELHAGWYHTWVHDVIVCASSAI
jgi:hypothetical protein